MANEADSRHTTPFPRWGETTSQVPDANVVEPSGGKKDIGWLPGGEGVVGEWWNWLHWAAGVFFRYLENTNALLWTRNHVMAGAQSTEGVVTAGVGLTVDVTSARVWISGQMQKVPAATNLALAAADPTLDRIDLVYAHVVASVPVYAVVTGTPDAFPVAPALPAGSVPLFDVEVDATDTTPSAIVDRRFFGAVTLDLARVDKQFSAGDLGANDFMVDLQDIGAAFSLKLGGTSDPAMEISDFGPQCIVKPEVFSFFTPITRKLIIDACETIPEAYSASIGAPQAGGDGGAYQINGSGRHYCSVCGIPHGATIVAVRLYGSKIGTAPGITDVRFNSRNKLTGAATDLISGTLTNTGAAGGDFVMEKVGLSHVVDSTKSYNFEIVGTTPTLVIHAYEVEYTEINPFNGV